MVARKKTQCKRILKYVKRHGSITNNEAQKHLAVMRLASRIWDIKKQGYTVTKVTEKGRNRYGEPTRYARYFIKEEKE